MKNTHKAPLRPEDVVEERRHALLERRRGAVERGAALAEVVGRARLAVGVGAVAGPGRQEVVIITSGAIHEVPVPTTARVPVPVRPRALLRHRPVELPVEALLPVADAVGPPERRRRRVLRHLGDLDRLHLAAHGRGDEAVHEHRVDEAVHHPRAAGEAAAEERVAGRVSPGAGRRHAEWPEHVVVQDRADGLARDLDGHGRGELERQARVHELGARRVHGPRRQRVVELLRAGREVAPAPGEGGERRGPERLARVAVVVREVAVRVDDHARRHAEHVAQRHGGPLVRGVRR